MKKIVSLIFLLGVLLALSACGHTHEYGDWQISTAATCTEDGVRERSCECGETETEAIPATGHTYENWETTTPATCTEDGAESSTCSQCGNVETQVIPATGHTYGEYEVTTPATCTEDGTETSTCTQCGETQVQTIAATGHNFTPATYYAPKTCSACGETEGDALATVLDTNGSGTGDGYEFTITDTYFTSKLSEKSGSTTYSYSNDGSYFVVKMTFKNLSTEAVEKYHSDRVSEISLVYGDTYEYEGEFCVLTGEIVPLGSANAYLLFAVPESMQTDTDKSLNAVFKVDNDMYAIRLREGTSAEEAGNETDASATDLTSDVAIGETRTDGTNFSFVFKDLSYSKGLSEKQGSTTYNYWEDGLCLVIKFEFTNLASEALEQYFSSRVSDVKLTYDSKYTYDGEFCVLTDDIVPLATANAYLVFPISEDVENGTGALTATFTIDGSTFNIDCRAN